MKFLVAFILAFIALSTTASAAPSPAPSPSLVGIALLPPIQNAPAVASSPSVPVAEPAAPPVWAQDLMVTAQGLPVIGPIVSKALLYLGILSSILTMGVAFLLSALNVVKGVFNWAGFADSVMAIEAFKNSKFMYWIKFFSLFNAKKDKPAA